MYCVNLIHVSCDVCGYLMCTFFLVSLHFQALTGNRGKFCSYLAVIHSPFVRLFCAVDQWDNEYNNRICKWSFRNCSRQRDGEYNNKQGTILIFCEDRHRNQGHVHVQIVPCAGLPQKLYFLSTLIIHHQEKSSKLY